MWAAPSADVAGYRPPSRRSYARSARTSTSVSQSARAPLKYDGVGKQIVHALKYRGYKRVVGRLAAPLMLQVLDDTRFDAVVPVPLHRSRLRKRGFNQAELLARGVAEKMKATVSDTLEVVRSTRDQVELSAAQRRANVAGAYSATGPLRGKILLVDDVFTTGATMSACATSLVRAGAGEVHALSLCQDMLTHVSISARRLSRLVSTSASQQVVEGGGKLLRRGFCRGERLADEHGRRTDIETS